MTASVGPREDFIMMNDFEKALRGLLDGNTHFDKLTYVGRSCFGQLNNRVRARLEFVTLGHAEHYEALRVTLLDREDGKIDVSTLRFAEVWGNKKVSNPNFKEGIHPHLWNDGGDADWYVYHPTAADAKVLCGQLNDYLSVFEPNYGQSPAHEQEITGPELSM